MLRSYLLAFGFLSALLVATSALAEPQSLYEIRVGLMAHDVDNLWSKDRAEDGFDLSGEFQLMRGSFGFWEGTARPSVGFSFHNRGETHKAYAGWLWERVLSERVFLNLGLGLAWHSGRKRSRDSDRKELGTRFLFRVPIELGLELGGHHRLLLSFDHISNADIGDENEGLDTLGLRYAYRF